ncbi:MAG TPA: methyltransferase domain-containing protein [Candidatus Lokiarchaeia archaeon]|nr:methyltransferase domain-containing protein [Candidatus Lokiarchaeia archaeon]
MSKFNRQIKFDIDPTRPEEEFARPTDYFTSERAVQYAQSSSMRKMQRKMVARALELVEIDTDAWVLDLGCGTGFGQELLAEVGVHVVGTDVAWAMLAAGRQDCGPRVCAEMTALPFRRSSFDTVISISAIQWILDEVPGIRDQEIAALVQELQGILVEAGSLVLQFYPRSSEILEDVKDGFGAMAAFDGHLVIDNPDNPKKRKIYLAAVKRTSLS